MAIKAQTKQTRLVLSQEQTEKAVQIYYAEGRKAAIEYLASQGSKAPEKCWDNIRHRLQVKPQAKSETPEQVPTVKLTGPIKIETPEAHNIDIVETPKKRSHTLLRNSNYTVRAIRTELGEFYYDKKFDKLDWRTPECEEVSMSPNSWFMLYEMIPEVMGILEVETDHE